MASRSLQQMQALRPREITIGGVVVITAAGAISAQGTMDNTGNVPVSDPKLVGATVAKTAGKNGRYGIAFDRVYKRIKAAGCSMVGPDDTAFPTTTGVDPMLRLLTSSGFSVQFCRQDTMADADPASGTKFCWWAVVALK